MVSEIGAGSKHSSDKWAGNALRDVRAKTGLTQRQLAAKAGVPSSTIAKIEAGTRQPTHPTMAKILAAVDFSLPSQIVPAPTTAALPVTTTPTPSKRAANKARTRLALMRATVELFNEQGFEQTTVDQIAGRAGSSPRTFFRYFGAKEDVVFGDHAEHLQLFREMLETAPRSERPLEVLRAALMEQLVGRVSYADPDLDAACVELWTLPGIRARWGDIVLEWEQVVAKFLAREWDLTPDDPNCRINAMIFVGVLRAAMVVAGHGGRERACAAAERGFDFTETHIGALAPITEPAVSVKTN